MAEKDENLQFSKLSPITKTRSAKTMLAPIILPPKATQQQVATAYGITSQQFHAAQRRKQRILNNQGHDGRQIGTDYERGLLARYAQATHHQRISQTRQDLASILLEMLQNRKALVYGGKPAPPLNPAEQRLLADAANPQGRGGMPSEEFFRYFDAQHELTLAKGREQEVKRTVCYTIEAAEEHFSKLKVALQNLDFLYTKGDRIGHIRDESELVGKILCFE